MTTQRIPPVTVDAETGALPTPVDFRKLPAEAIQVGDILRFSDGTLWRVKRRGTFKTSPMHHFILHPCAGGAPRGDVFFPRTWLDVARGF